MTTTGSILGITHACAPLVGREKCPGRCRKAWATTKTIDCLACTSNHGIYRSVSCSMPARSCKSRCSMPHDRGSERAFPDVCWRMLTYAIWCMLTYADVCWRMLTYAHTYVREEFADLSVRFLTYADVCWRMLYAVCWRMLTSADVRTHLCQGRVRASYTHFIMITSHAEL